MGFFDTLFGGGAEREAANANRSAISGYAGTANSAFDTGLSRSTGAATGARDAAGNLLDQNSGIYGDLLRNGMSALDSGRASQVGALSGFNPQNAGAFYDPLASLGTKYGGASSLYLDSLGVNGAAGNTRATDAFHTGPGYQFTMDQGLEALNRRRAAAGMLGSGNADIDAMKFGTGLADQTYGDWQTRLGSFTPYELSATSGAASGRAGAATSANSLDLSRLGMLSGIYGNDTAARLGLMGSVAGGEAGINNQKASNELALGNTLGQLYTGDASNRAGIAGNQLSGNVSANNMQAQGEATGARNLLGAGMGLASMAMSAGMGGMPMMGMGGGGMGGGGGGGSSFFSSLFPTGGGTGYGTNPWSSQGMFGAGPAGASAGYR